MLRYLIIHNLLKWFAFVEKTVELDHVRVLDSRSNRLVSTERVMRAGAETDHRIVLIGSPVEA